MDFSAILNLVIGLIFVYFLLSLACSTVQELIAQYLDLRANNLENWLKSAFKENKLGEKFLEHRLIDGLTPAGRKASYIPSKVFSGVLLDLVNDKEEPYTINSIKDSIKNSELPEDLKRQLLQTISEAGNGLEELRKNIEGWFNDCMTRIAGTYKKKAQIFLIIISTITVVSFNIDSIQIIQYLYNHPAESEALANTISENIEDLKLEPRDSVYENSTTEQKIESNIKELERIKGEIESAKIPFGWGTNSAVETKLLNKILGLFLSVVAGIVGAPFWFDTLNKVVNLRSAGSKPES